CQNEADRERAQERLLKAPVILSSPGPGHDERTGVKPADFPLDDPLVPEPLLLFLRFEELVLDQSRTMLFLVDLFAGAVSARFQLAHAALEGGDTSAHPTQLILTGRDCLRSTDRKSTRLNSSHQIISYAVFCLKKKNY